MGVAAFVLGLIGILICWIPYVGYLGMLLCLLAMILGGVSAKKASSKGLAITGAVLGTIGFLIGLTIDLSSSLSDDAHSEDAFAFNNPQRGVVPGAQVSEGSSISNAPQYDPLGATKLIDGINASLKHFSSKTNVVSVELLFQNSSGKEKMISTALFQMTSEEGEMGELDYNLASCDGVLLPNGALQCQLFYIFKKSPKVVTLRIQTGFLSGAVYFNIPTELKEACGLYQKACNGREMTGCNALGACYGNGAGGFPKDDKRACDLFKEACDGGEMKGCHNLGVCYKNGAGGFPKDKKIAADLFQKACSGGEKEACNKKR